MLALNQQGTAALGIARYVHRVGRPDAAEVAGTVIDDWQGRGLGTLLPEAISARARAEGIRTFTALMLTENHEMLDLLKRLGPVRIVKRACRTGEIRGPDAARRGSTCARRTAPRNGALRRRGAARDRAPTAGVG
jgi:GNAT superfamily N-acetyltransferase